MGWRYPYRKLGMGLGQASCWWRLSCRLQGRRFNLATASKVGAFEVSPPSPSIYSRRRQPHQHHLPSSVQPPVYPISPHLIEALIDLPTEKSSMVSSHTCSRPSSSTDLTPHMHLHSSMPSGRDKALARVFHCYAKEMYLGYKGK